jgi:hypothetical protein
MTRLITIPPRGRKIVLWVVVGGLLFLAVSAVAFSIILSPGSLERTAEEKLSERLGLDVTIGTLSVSLLPYPKISGTDLVFRMRNAPDLPPFIEIPEFSADGGFFALSRGHVSTVRLEGMRITVPPGDQREGLDGGGGAGGTAREIIVDHLEARDAVLTLLRRSPDRDPLVFRIHGLSVRDVGFDLEMPFSADLTNPVPQGLVHSTGRIGPWIKGNPTAFPVSGAYTFTRANLDTIKGIGGTLTSAGNYAGRLTEIVVTGTTDTPDFNLDLGGKPVPLATRFKAIVNASNGTTMLERVDAKIFNTSLVVSGLVENLPGPKGHQITLDVGVDDGRIEDILALVADTKKPLLTGDVHLKSDVSLPPGEGPVRDRLVLGGRFGLDRGEFTDSAVQAKLMELSRRSQGKDEDERMSRVVTQLSGDFRLAKGSLRLNGLRFRVPGATVALSGTYQLATAELDFAGTLRMQATVSKAVGGFKSVFLKPFDFLFRRDGAGAVVPIRITGQPDAPKMGVRFGSVFGGKD